MARPRRVRLVLREAGATEQRGTIIDYGSIWKYLQGSPGHSDGFEDPAFDDSSWDSGPAAFGVVGDGEQTGGHFFPPCVYNRPFIGTAWDINTDLCVRKRVNIPEGVDRVYFEFGIDNVGAIYLNGDLVYESSNVGCQTRGSQSFWYDNPPTGDVVVAVRCTDPSPSQGFPSLLNNETFFDLKLDVVGPSFVVSDADWSAATVNVWGNITGNTPSAWFDGSDGTVQPITVTTDPFYWCHVALQTIEQIRIKWNGTAQSSEFWIEWSDDVDPDFLPVALGGTAVPTLNPGGTWHTAIHAVCGTGGGACGDPAGEVGYYDSDGVFNAVNWSAGYFTSDYTFDVGTPVTARLWRIRLGGSGNSDIGTISAVGTGFSVSDQLTDRSPGRVVATIEDAKAIGVSKFHNGAGELFFTLQNFHPQIGFILPWQTHWTVEEHRGEGWTPLNFGWITDYDSTDQETIFYGLDYIGILSLLNDERFNPEQAPDRAAEIYPADAAGTGGSKYVEETIRNIVIDQIDRAIGGGTSPLNFFTRGAIATMDETVTIFCTLKERLAFIGGLIDSHRAGTGKKTRLQAVMTRSWIDARSWTEAFDFRVLDDPGQDRNDLRFEYGGHIQGYRVIPFGEFATRILAVGKTSTGFRLEFHIEPTPAPEGEASDYAEQRWGRLNRVNFWEDIIDLNDLRRRARQLAAQVGAVGKNMGIGIRVDALGVEDGWDICDSVPVVIQRGPLDTTTMGEGLWTIWGWAAIFNSNGYSETVLTLLPKEPAQDLPDDWDASVVVPQPDDFAVHDGPPDETVSPGSPGTWVDSTNGHVWTVDPETGLWVDQTDAGNFEGLFALPSGGTVGDYLRHDGTGSEWQKNNLAAAVAPTVNEDSGDGYSVGSIWTDTTADQWYVCLDATVAAAVWRQILPISLSGLASGDRLRYDGSVWRNTRRVWMPLTTVVGGVPELVWDADNSLIPTEVPE